MMVRRFFLKVLGLGAFATTAPQQPLAHSVNERRIFYLEDYGLNGDALIGGEWNAKFTDNAPLWNAIIERAQPFDEYVCPPGYMGFKSKPLMFPDYCKLSGRGAFAGLVKCYTPEDPTEFFFEVGPQYVTLERLILYQGAGQSLGRAFGRVATGAGGGLYGLVARDITISSFGDAKWRDAVVLDGTKETKLYGARTLCIDHLFVGAAVEDMALCLSGIEGGGNIDKFQAAAGKLVLSGVKGINRSNVLHISGNCNAAITMNNTLASKIGRAHV